MVMVVAMRPSMPTVSPIFMSSSATIVMPTPAAMVFIPATHVWMIISVHGVVFYGIITVIPAIPNYFLFALPAPVLAIFGTVNIGM